MSQLLEEVNFDLSPNTDLSAVVIKKELYVLLENFNSEDVEAVPSIQNPLNKVGNEQTTVAVNNSCNKICKIANENNVKIENDFSASKTNLKADSHNININTEGLEEEIKDERDFEHQCNECKLCGHITVGNDSLEHHLKIKHDVRVKLAHNEFEDIEIDIKYHNLSYECLEIKKNEDVKEAIINNKSDNKEETSALNDVCNDLTQMECEKDIGKECTDTAPINESDNEYNENISALETNSADSHNININTEGLKEEIRYKHNFEEQCYESKLCGHITENNNSLEHDLKFKHDVRIKLAHYEFEDTEIDIKYNNLSYECLEIEKNEDVKQVITNNQSDNKENTSTLNGACNKLTLLECEEDNENECIDMSSINGSDNEPNENISTSKTNSVDSHNININIEGSEEEIKDERDSEFQCNECKLCGHITESNDSLEHHLKIKHAVRVKLAQYKFEDIEIDIKYHNLSYECLGIEKNEDVKQVITNIQLDDKQKTALLDDVFNELTQVERQKDMEKECIDTAPINENDNEHNENVSASKTNSEADSRNINISIEGSEEEIEYKSDFEDQCNECKLCGHITESNDSLEHHLKIRHDVRVKLAQYKFEDIEIYKKHNLSYKKTATLDGACNELTQMECEKDIENECTGTASINESDNEHNENFKFHQCLYCRFRTTLIAELNIHTKNVHEDKWYNCQFCGFKTKNRYYLVKHLRKKHDSTGKKYNGETKWFSCELCTYKTKHELDLTQHIKTKHIINEQLCCLYCDYKSENKSSLKKHFKMKHDKYARWYTCFFCLLRTKSLYHYKEHLKEKHANMKYQCEFCEYTTPRKHSLKEHFKVKHDEDAEWLKCTLCEYKTKLKGRLVVHLYASHIATKRYKCKICKHRTEYKVDLKRHYAVKHDENAQWYHCDLCQYKTKARLYLIRHFSLQHKYNENTMQHQCQFCEQKLKSKISLNRHIKFKHEKNIGWLYCKVCKFKSKRKLHLRNHIKLTHGEGDVQGSEQ